MVNPHVWCRAVTLVPNVDQMFSNALILHIYLFIIKIKNFRIDFTDTSAETKNTGAEKAGIQDEAPSQMDVDANAYQPGTLCAAT